MKKHLLISKGLIVVLTFAVTMSTAAFTPAQAQNQSAPAMSIYQTLLERARQEGKAREMTLAECMELALKKNLSIEISHYQPLLSQQSLNSALGVYDFGLNSSISYGKSEGPTFNRTDVFTGVSTSLSKMFSFNTTLSRYLPTGGTASVTMVGDRFSTMRSFINPYYDGNLTFNLTQPLWKNFSIDQQRYSILTAKKDRQIADINFEKAVADIIQGVENSYWDLINTIEQQKIQIQSRELALITLRDNQRRVEVGTIAPITVTQTKSQVASAEQAVIQAEAYIIQAENTLKNLIANDPADPLWSLVIIPTDKPEIPSGLPPVEEALKTALEKRPEVRSLKLTLEKDDLAVSLQHNQTRPSFDLVVSYGTQGMASPNAFQTDSSGNLVLDPNGDPIPTPLNGGFGKVYDQVFRQKYRNYSFKLNFQYYIGNHTAKANLAQANIGKNQDLSSLKTQLQSIQVEVINAIQTIEVDRKSLDAAVVARQYNEEQLDGQTKRFQAGLVTNFEVLQTQRDLANARATEMQNRIYLKKAFVALQRATFTNLDQNKMSIVNSR